MYSLTLCIRKEERLKINCLAISRCCWNNRKSHLQTKNNKANKHKLRQGKRSYIISLWIQFSSVQSLSRVRLFATPWTTACRASLSITNSCSLPKFMSIESVMSSTISSSVVPFSSCPQSLPASESFPMSQIVAWGGQSTGVSALASFFPRNPRADLLQNGLVGSPCSPTDSQESSPTPQFKSINSSVLSFLHSPTLTSIHDYWKNHSLD